MSLVMKKGKESQESQENQESQEPRNRVRKTSRFGRISADHRTAIEGLGRRYPFLRERLEIHMPYHRARGTFERGTLWVWPKFDKRPVAFLVFLEGWPPCVWYPDRQEGLTFRWSLPPLMFESGPTVCLANLLPSESVLQVEDLLIHQGKVWWQTETFSARWALLSAFWSTVPVDVTVLGVTPRLVEPLTLEKWPNHYDFAIYWIIQPDHAGQARWYWKDVVTPHACPTYVAPQLKRNAEVMGMLCAECRPYKGLPDVYTLWSQEGEELGVASIATLEVSQALRAARAECAVEVRWLESFQKYQVVRILPEGTPISTSSFFQRSSSASLDS